MIRIIIISRLNHDSFLCRILKDTKALAKKSKFVVYTIMFWCGWVAEEKYERDFLIFRRVAPGAKHILDRLFAKRLGLSLMIRNIIIFRFYHGILFLAKDTEAHACT